MRRIQSNAHPIRESSLVQISDVSPRTPHSLKQQKGPARLSARDPFERFSTLLTQLQSQQLAGVQGHSARYKYRGISALFQCEHSTG